MVQESIKEYDAESQTGAGRERADFLAYLRQQRKSIEAVMSTRDLMKHLTMRMHPGVSYPLERVVPEGGVELCGVHLTAGTVVGVNAAVIHRNRDIFGKDADEFRPERWMGEETKAKGMDRTLFTVGAPQILL